MKSLIQFRCVCKSCYFSITDPKFINNHHALKQAKLYNHNGYVLYKQINQNLEEASFCRDMCNVDGTLSSASTFVIPFSSDDIVGYCNSLICATGCDNRTMYLWNPSIRKFKTVTGSTLTVKNVCIPLSAFGFAYHSQKNDYKIVRIALLSNYGIKILQNVMVVEAEVYTLSTDMWRRVEVPLHNIFLLFVFKTQAPFVNGALHWPIWSNYELTYLSFDVDTERFGEIMPPPRNYLRGVLTEFKGKLALVFRGQDADEAQCFIWVMWEYGLVESWVQQIVPLNFSRFFGCANNGQLLIQSDDGELCLFDLETLHENLLGVGDILGVCDISWASHTLTFVESMLRYKSRMDSLIQCQI